MMIALLLCMLTFLPCAAQEHSESALFNHLRKLPSDVVVLIFKHLAPQLNTWELTAKLKTYDGTYKLSPDGSSISYTTIYQTQATHHTGIPANPEPTHHHGKKIINRSPDGTRRVVYDPEIAGCLLVDKKGETLAQLAGPHTLFSANSETLIAYKNDPIQQPIPADENSLICQLYHTADGKNFSSIRTCESNNLKLSPDGKKIMYTHIDAISSKIIRLDILNEHHHPDRHPYAQFWYESNLTFSPCSTFILSSSCIIGNTLFTIEPRGHMSLDNIHSFERLAFKKKLHTPHFITGTSLICLGQRTNEQNPLQSYSFNAHTNWQIENPLQCTDLHTEHYHTTCWPHAQPTTTIINPLQHEVEQLHTEITELYAAIVQKRERLDQAQRALDRGADTPDLPTLKENLLKQITEASTELATKERFCEALLQKSIHAARTMLHRPSNNYITFPGSSPAFIADPDKPTRSHSAITKIGTTLNVYRNNLSPWQALFKTMIINLVKKSEQETTLPEQHAQELIKHSLMKTFSLPEQKSLTAMINKAAELPEPHHALHDTQ